MRKLYFFVVLTLVAVSLSAQQSLLVFMEASEKKPFYVRIGAKTNASTSTGQVYLTELPDLNYEIHVGFPETDGPEHRFQVTLRKNDNNFQLKQGGAQGWTLIDLESNQTLQPISQVQGASYAIHGVRKNDAFSIMMAGVVNDTSVLYTSVIPTAPAKEQIAKKTPADSNTAAPAGNAPGVTTGSTLPAVSAQAPTSPVTATDTTATQSTAQKAADVIDSASVKKAEGAVANSSKEVKPVADSGSNNSILIQIDSAKVAANAQAIKDQEVRDQVAKDELAKAEAARDQLSKDQAAKDQAAKDQVAKDQLAKDQAAKEQAAKDQLAKDQAAKDQAAKAEIGKETAAGAVSIRKLSENKNDKQLSLKYTDAAVSGRADTIEVIIPIEPLTTSTPRKDSVRVKYSPNERPLRDPVSPAAPVSDTVKSRGSAADDKKSVTPPASSGPVMINSDCVNFATEYDVDKLRVKMVNEVTADDRVAAAKKVFRTKCFTSRQIRALTELFLNDEGKYKFLDASYPFVSDSQEFRKLVDVLKDEYYVNRFNAMIRG